MKNKYIFFIVLVLSSCATRRGATKSQMPNEKECLELYGELETKEIHITQDRVRFFGFCTPKLPIDDTVVITVPNNINHGVICYDPAYYIYNNGSGVFIWDELDLSPELDDELRQRMNEAWNRNFFSDSETSEGEKFFVPETTIIEGVDENGLCWKTVNFEFMSYGYSSVPPEHKWYFDKILGSFHKKTPSYEEVFEEIMKNM